MKQFFEWFDAAADDLMSTEWFGGCVMFCGLVVVACMTLIILVVAFGLFRHAPPSLFCPNGAEVQTSPDTVVIGKVPEDGTRYTCNGGAN